MSLQHLLLLVLFPLALGVVVFVFRQSFRLQIASILFGAVLHALFLVALEVLPQGGLDAHGNTWQGYALIELGPFLIVLVVMAALRSLRFPHAVAAPFVVAISVPLSYWVGLLIALSVAVTAGVATP